MRFLLALVQQALGVAVRLRVSACRPRGRRHPALSSFGGHDGRLDHSRSLVRSRVACGALTCLGVLVLATLSLVPREARAADPTKSQAFAACAARLTGVQQEAARNGWRFTGSCVEVPSFDGSALGCAVIKGHYDDDPDSTSQFGGGGCWTVDDTDQPNQCASHVAPSGSKWGAAYASGSKVCADSCEFVFTQAAGSISVGIPGQSTGISNGTFAPTGASCTSSDTPPPASNDPPPLCNGGSCYDSSANKFCSVNSSGVQTCVSGPKDPGGGAPPKQDSACAVNGSSAQCAHAASDPAPTPPNPPISDPQKQQTGTGSFSAGNAGGITGISTGTYQGSTSSSGGDGSGGDGSGGDGEGEGDCTAGKACDDAYTDAACGAAPSTAGDPLLSQMAIEAHRQRCVHEGIANELAGADKSLGDDHQPGEVFVDDKSDTQQFDDSGFLGGGGQCPGLPDVEYMGHPVLSADGMCETAPILAGFVLFAAYVLAAVVAARITSGSKD